MRSAYYFFILIFLWSFNLAAQRNIQTINSAWEFSSEKNKKTEVVNIPHTWNAEDAFRDGKEYFRGKGTYKKSLFVPQEWQQKRNESIADFLPKGKAGNWQNIFTPRDREIFNEVADDMLKKWQYLRSEYIANIL